MSSADGLWLTEITIRRMPGFPHGGLRVTDLAPAINILVGPNGAGKTTLARAIQKGMAPGSEPKSAEVELLCKAGTEAWSLEVRDQTVAALQNGSASRNPLELAPQDTPRYILSLPELIATDKGVEFAAQIRNEAAGGYDVAQSAKELRFTAAPAEPRAKARELAQALKTYGECAAAQKEVASRVERLAELQVRYQSQKRAASEAALLEAFFRSRAASARRAEFSDTVAQLKGDDEKYLATLQNAAAAWEAQIEQHQSDLHIAEAAAAAQDLTEEVDSAWLDSTMARLAGISDLEGQLKQSYQQRDAARARERSERETLAGPAVETDLGTLILNDEFWRECHQVAEDNAACQARRRAMAELKSALNPPDSAPDTGACKEAIDCLRQWLAAPDPAPAGGPFKVAAAALGLSVIAIGLLAWRGGAFWMALLAAPVILAFWLVAQKPRADARAAAEQNWQRLQQPPPSEWTPEAVNQLLRQREQQFAELQLESARFTRWQATTVDREALDADERAAASRAEAVRAKFGLASASDGASDVSLLARFDALKSWRDAQRAAEDAEAGIASIASSISDALQPVASGLLPYGYSGLTDSHAAGLALQKLKARSTEFARRSQTCADLRAAIETARTNLAGSEAQIAEFYETRLLPDGDSEGLRAALDQLDHFKASKNELLLAEAGLQDARARCLQAGVEPESRLTAAQGMTEADAAAEVRRLRESADQCDATFKEITEIEAAARQFGDGHALEDALFEVDRLRGALVWLRDQNVAAAVGSAVATWAERVAREATEPPVQARARELFAMFTNSRYRLDLQQEGAPAFCATDTVSRRSHTLEELSSGTRAQLLMAVRLAFIETQERGLRLPIVLDEVLANSDSERASAIMLAAAQIAGEGRQVFYLTAQPEEVHRWQEALRGGGFPDAAVIDIQLAKRVEAQRIQPRTPAPLPIPPPEGRTSAEYATALEVPGINRRAPVSHVHLWYFEPEPEELYRLLVRGFREWGPLAAALDAGFATPVNEQRARRYRAAARALEDLLEIACIGRGRPVTRQALTDGGISTTFIDRVDEAARMHGGNAPALMEALQSGAVKGLQRRSIEQLEQYLVENDYLSRDPEVPVDECVRRSMARRESDIAAGLLEPEAVRRLAAFVYAGL